MNSFDEKTRVTNPENAQAPDAGQGYDDCIVVIYAKELNLLGKRFVLRGLRTKIGRGADNDIVLDGDSVSRRHCHVERRGGNWYMVDDGSTNGTDVNDTRISAPTLLKNGYRIKVGPTIFKFLSGEDVEAKYHEEIYQLTIIDGLTQAYNKRYLFEALDREIVRARRHNRPLSVVMFDIDHFKQINDHYGHLAGDVVLKELAALVRERIRRDELLSRYGGEEFVIMAPETELEGAVALAEDIRRRVEAHVFGFQSDRIQVTVSLGCAILEEHDRNTTDLLKRVDERLYEAKRGGRNQVVS